MTVIMFQPRFAELVKSGEKMQTIRRMRKRPVKVGDSLSLRKWAGTPRRSGHVTLRERICKSVDTIYLQPAGRCQVLRNGIGLSERQGEVLALRDGFESVAEMLDWFDKTHGLPFEGVLITW